MRYSAAFFLLFALAGCVSQPRRVLVLRYEDFGPQAAAYSTIGFEWYQWNHHGDPEPGKADPIKVVVYDGVSLEKVKQQYPVIPSVQQDFRYLSLPEARSYLDRLVKEIVQDEKLKELAESCRQTRLRIDGHFEVGN